MKPEIIFEDNHLLVVQKPPGILSQADSSKKEDMLNLLKTYLKETYQKPGNVYLGLVHRLDTNVGGTMVFAKTSKAAERLSEQIRNHTFKKEYLAVVEDNQNDLPKSETLINYIVKDKVNLRAKVLDKHTPDSKEAILTYYKISHMQNLSLIRVALKTGRFHQIRAQMSENGYPIVGDAKYGSSKKYDLALWSYKLGFEHPVSKEKLVFTSNPPRKFPWTLF